VVAEPLTDLAILVIASACIYLFAAFADWRISLITHPRLVALRGRWQNWPLAPLPVGGVRLLYYVGIPYAAILQGDVDLRTFGLIGADLPAALLLGAGVGLAAWIVLALAWRRLAPSVQADAPAGNHWHRGDAWPGLLDAVCSQAHWALYRSWPVLVWGPYYGVFAGLALAAAELLAVLLLRHDWTRTGTSIWAWEIGLTRLGLAWITALVFLASGSLWACLLVHAGLAWVLFQRRQPMPVEGADSAQEPG
jgi:hypothetical protein